MMFKQVLFDDLDLMLLSSLHLTVTILQNLFIFSFHTFDSDRDKNEDGTVEEEDEGEEEFWNGKNSKDSSTVTTPSPVKSHAISHQLKATSPDHEKPPPVYTEKILKNDSVITEEDEAEMNGNGGPPVSAGAVVINVLASPTSTIAEESETERTSVLPNGSPGSVSQ